MMRRRASVDTVHGGVELSQVSDPDARRRRRATGDGGGGRGRVRLRSCGSRENDGLANGGSHWPL